MMVHVPEFDDELTITLIVEAANAGETMEMFIARAVAARLAQIQTHRSAPQLAGLLSHIEQLQLAIPASEAAAHDVLEDPERLHALYATGLLDAGPDPTFDRFADVAAKALAAPAAAVSLVAKDRQVFAGLAGIEGELAITRQTPIERSVCRHAVMTGEPLIVDDARIHPLLKDHPAVVDGALVAYAGIPLIDNHDHAIGTLCVWDSAPRQWSQGHVFVLTDLAGLVRERLFQPSAVA